MTLILAHQIDGNLAVVTDGADFSGPKCCFFQKHSAIVPFWGYYDLCPTALSISPDAAPPAQKHLAKGNYIGDTLPLPKDDKDKFVAAFEAGLKKAENIHNGDGKQGSSGVLLGFACKSGIEAFVYDVNSGRSSWEPRGKVQNWPVLYGQAHEALEMLAKNYKKSLTDFIGPVKSIDDFAKKAKELIALTSDYLESKHLQRSIALPAWQVVLSKDGSITQAKL
jgi:hypothetical protein